MASLSSVELIDVDKTNFQKFSTTPEKEDLHSYEGYEEDLDEDMEDENESEDSDYDDDSYDDDDLIEDEEEEE